MSDLLQEAPAEGVALPSGWSVRPLHDVADIERAGVRPEDIRAGTLFVGLEHIEAGGRILGVEAAKPGDIASTKFRFDEGHVLYGKLRPYLSKIALPDFAGICSTDILPIRPGPDLDRNYFAHFLRQPEMVVYAASRASGANLPRLSPTVLGTFPIPLPPLAEQRRIAGILDAADALRAKRRESIALLDTLTQSIFLDMFGDPASNRNQWDRLPLAGICGSPDDIKCGPFGTQLAKSEYRADGIPLWGIKNVNSHFALPTKEFLSTQTADRLTQYSIRPGDIVMTRKGTVGNCSVYPEGWPEGVMHSDLLRIRLDLRVSEPEFISAQLQLSRDVERQLALISGGAVMPGLNVGKLKHLEVLLPPVSLQSQFASRVGAVRRQRSRHALHQARLDALFGSLQSRAFRGEL